LYAEAYYNNGIIFVELKQYEKAIIYYEKAITLNPNYAEAYSNKSLIHLLLSDFKKHADFAIRVDFEVLKRSQSENIHRRCTSGSISTLTRIKCTFSAPLKDNTNLYLDNIKLIHF
jgi:tetratricopeptide (TPR) repeat protein